MEVEIDKKSGFCFGVVNAIKLAEEAILTGSTVSSLGDIVHNSQEVARLEAMGLKTIGHSSLRAGSGSTVLFRAHGEPPSSYQLMQQAGAKLVDATCPVVVKLQSRVRKAYTETLSAGGQIVIYGKHGHAEVAGLVGHADGNAIVVSSADEIDKIDFSIDVHLFSQTTKSITGYAEMKALLEEKLHAGGGRLFYHDTICRQVSNREPELRIFAAKHDAVLFVSSPKSSNGKYLFSVCREVNPKTYFIENAAGIDRSWFSGKENLGVCGATSTPLWLMEEVAEAARQIAF
jgi:4-hydroxy-3-methylbut-2-en-1-yl diphosphate reductase